MICPNDLTRMHQFEKEGGGLSTEDKYERWEIKICSLCKRKVKEYYSVEVLKAGEELEGA